MGWPLPRSPMNSREGDGAVLDHDPPSGNMIAEAFGRQQRRESGATRRTVGQLLKQVGDSVRNSPHDTDDDDDHLPPSPYHHILDFKGMSPAADGSGGQAPPPFVLSFAELTYSVKVRKRSALSRSTGGREGRRTRVILDSVSGEAREGEILAVLGASGSGKSTFIDALAGRIAAGSLHGRVTLNGEALVQMGHLLKTISTYVMQDDLLHPMLTVEEVLTFAAEFRLPRSVPRSKKRLRVSDLIDQLGLRDVADTIIGDERRRGVSGGERRRASIGADIIHDPIILFLDEPTSGLDSTSAYRVVHVLREIARSGSVVVMSVHQPSSRILGLLDRLLFLSRGRAVYSGVPGELPSFFADFGRPVPQKESHAEFALDLILELEATADGTEELVQHHRQWQAKHAGKEAVAPSTLPRDGAFTLRDAVSASISRGKLVSGGAINVAKMGGGAGAGAASGHVPAGSANPFWIEVGVLTKRSFTNSRRQLVHIIVFPQIVVFVTGFMFSAIFWRLPHSVAAIQERLGFLAFAVTATYFTCAVALPEFIQERYIFIRETAHNAYRRSSYVLAGMLTMIPNIFVLSVTFGAVTFFGVGLAGGFSGFLFYLGVILACYWAGTSYVTFLSGVVPDIQLGFTAVVSSLCSFFLLGGFFLSRDRIPRYWLWLHYVSLVKYGFEAVALNEFGEPGRCFLKGDQLIGQVMPLAGLPPETKAGLLEALGMMLRRNLTEETCFVNGPYVQRAVAATDLGKWACLWIIVAWGFIFRVLFYFSLLIGSKNKRK